MHIRSYPDPKKLRNPYLDLFYNALQKQGIYLQSGLEINPTWIVENNQSIQGIHLHWPEDFWRNYPADIPVVKKRRGLIRFLHNNIPFVWRLTKSTLESPDEPNYKRPKGTINKCKGLINLFRFLRLARKYDIQVAWTFHNTQSHEGDDYLDKIGYMITAKMANLIILHSASSRADFTKRYSSNGKKTTMPIGNYKDVYPSPRDKATVFKELGLNETLPMVSCIGMIRDYKGIDTACEAIKSLNGRCQLLIAGAPHDTFDLDKLTTNVNNIPGTKLIPQFVSDQDFADYSAASDLILLPYQRINGSSALLAALTFSRGVVASDLPYFREIIGGTPNAGRLFKQGDPVALADAITSFLEVDELTRNSSAETLCTNYDWDNVITDVAKAYKDWGNKNAR